MAALADYADGMSARRDNQTSPEKARSVIWGAAAALLVFGVVLIAAGATAIGIVMLAFSGVIVMFFALGQR